MLFPRKDKLRYNRQYKWPYRQKLRKQLETKTDQGLPLSLWARIILPLDESHDTEGNNP